MKVIANISDLLILDILPDSLLCSMIDAEIDRDSIETPLLDALEIKSDVLNFIDGIDFEGSVSILSSFRTIELSLDGTVSAEW